MSRPGADFFRRRSGLAGVVTHKFMTYHFRLAPVGDTEEHLEAGRAPRDWGRESNRPGQVPFVPSLEALAARPAP